MLQKIQEKQKHSIQRAVFHYRVRVTPYIYPSIKKRTLDNISTKSTTTKLNQAKQKNVDKLNTHQREDEKHRHEQSTNMVR